MNLENLSTSFKTETICVTTSDNETIEIDIRDAVLAEPIRLALIFSNCDNIGKPTILIPEVDSEILKHILAWLAYHRICAVPHNAVGKLSNWDVTFFQYFDDQKLVKLIHAVDYLDIRGLFNMAIKVLSDRIVEFLPQQPFTNESLEKDAVVHTEEMEK